jgi:hypothetical protein
MVRKPSRHGEESAKDYSTTISVDQTPKQIFDAINNVRGWWSEEIGSCHRMLRRMFRRLGLLYQRQFAQPDYDR